MNKYIAHGVIVIFLIVTVNILLWKGETKNTDVINEVSINVKTNESLKDNLSDNFEYPSPVKQLQQVLVKSYQPPVHYGEDIFPDELLEPDDLTTAKAEYQFELDHLRNRIDSLTKNLKDGE